MATTKTANWSKDMGYKDKIDAVFLPLVKPNKIEVQPHFRKFTIFQSWRAQYGDWFVLNEDDALVPGKLKIEFDMVAGKFIGLR